MFREEFEMKVYIVFLHDYDKTRNLAVFKHQGDAEEFIKTLRKDDASNADIDEWEVQ